jgi:hypothetical protein
MSHLISLISKRDLSSSELLAELLEARQAYAISLKENLDIGVV